MTKVVRKGTLTPRKLATNTQQQKGIKNMKKLVYTIATDNGSLKDRVTGDILSTGNWKVAQCWAATAKGKVVPHYLEVEAPKPSII